MNTSLLLVAIIICLLFINFTEYFDASKCSKPRAEMQPFIIQMLYMILKINNYPW